MTSTGRDRIWSLTLDLARVRYERGYLRDFTPETVATVADQRGLDTSVRTVRRVLDSMSELDQLKDVSEDGQRRYRWLPREVETETSTDTSTDARNGETASADDSTNVSDIRRRTVDISVAGPTSPFEDRRLIYHLFADTGVESEPLSAYGTVVRLGLDPHGSEDRFSEVLRGDATSPPLKPEADLVVVHPYCQKWSPATRISGTQEDHPDQLDEAREVARELGEDYILENVPDAPLEDPVELSGDMFGLPVPYRRAFETSFAVPTPRTRASIDDWREPFEGDDGQLGVFRGEVDYWRTVKQVSGNYPAEELKRSGIPAPYIHWLARHWLRSRDDVELEETVETSGGVES